MKGKEQKNKNLMKDLNLNKKRELENCMNKNKQENFLMNYDQRKSKSKDSPKKFFIQITNEQQSEKKGSSVGELSVASDSSLDLNLKEKIIPKVEIQADDSDSSLEVKKIMAGYNMQKKHKVNKLQAKGEIPHPKSNELKRSKAEFVDISCEKIEQKKSKSADKSHVFDNEADFIPIPATVRFLSKDQNSHLANDDQVANIDQLNPPWMTDKVINERGHLKLHYEIKAFYEFIKPNNHENELREKSIKLLKTAINEQFPQWRIKTFGSYSTNLHLPDSDIDIIILQDPEESALSDDYMFNKIRTILLSNELVSYIQIIKAKVPVIKAVVKSTGINIDISVNRKNGYQAQKDINQILEVYPFIRELIYVLKYFLRQRGLNESYSGGLSSFLLFNLVYTHVSYFLKTTTILQSRITLSHLLVSFFQFYGFDFNYREVGISIRNGGFFFLREDKNWGLTEENRLLSVENYQDITQDIGKSAFKYSAVINKFKNARDQLLFPDKVENSFLDKILNVDKFLLDRAKQMQREV